jgi:hypothetical protein
VGKSSKIREVRISAILAQYYSTTTAHANSMLLIVCQDEKGNNSIYAQPIPSTISNMEAIIRYPLIRSAWLISIGAIIFVKR